MGGHCLAEPDAPVSYTHLVEIRNEEDNLVLSDNFFDMNAGVKRVRVLEGNTDKLMVRSVFDIK